MANKMRHDLGAYSNLLLSITIFKEKFASSKQSCLKTPTISWAQQGESLVVSTLRDLRIA